jgi:hypothetical protein
VKQHTRDNEIEAKAASTRAVFIALALVIVLFAAAMGFHYLR